MLNAFELQIVKNDIATRAKNGNLTEMDHLLYRHMSSPLSKDLLTHAYIEAAKAGQHLLMQHILHRQQEFWAFINYADRYQGLFEICKTGNFTLLAEHGDFDRCVYPKSLLCFCLEKMFAENWQNDAIKSFIQNFAMHTKTTWCHDDCIELCQQYDKGEISRCMLDSFKEKQFSQQFANLQINRHTA